MNKDRRKRLEKITDRLNEAKENALPAIETLKAAVEAAKEDAEAIRDEEQEASDNLPENMQEGEKGEKMRKAIDLIEIAISGLEEFAKKLDPEDALTEAVDSLISASAVG